ncbi:MAG: alpha/beta fold hydrolase [Desulfobacterales bacterium]|nr:alpha/beta fold hydrolase [Desulfobacterales bacterium]
MNRFAYRTTALAIKWLSKLSKARMNIHGEKNIPSGSKIFVINHFTRMETILIPYQIDRLIDVPVWSLADYGLFKGSLAAFLDKVGAISTKNPDRDLLIVKSLLTGEAAWVIFPEGRMVKNKKIVEKGRLMISFAGGKHPPHTGAATLALRTEFYRQRLRHLSTANPDEAKRLLELFNIESVNDIMDKSTSIVPVNLTYYPIRAQENILSVLATRLVGKVPGGMLDEILTEGTMIFSGVDIDIRIGKPIKVNQYLEHPKICEDVVSNKQINFEDTLPSINVMRRAALKIMQQYMMAIYGMTTINHDHLFASMLRMMPFKKIDEDDLRRRVFLATTEGFDKKGMNIHSSVEMNQTHLITDDRFHKFKDFIKMAKEKNLVQGKGKIIIKNRSRIASILEFHSARIENPIAISANEVEPLWLLQKCIKRLAWKSKKKIRKLVAEKIIKKSLSDFHEDYEKFYVKGESKDKSVGMPFLIKGRTSGIGVVLVHGYMAAPLEVRELAVYLGKRGIWVYVPRVKGHGTSPDDLAIRKYSEWVNSVDEGYAIISCFCDTVVVGGFSNGAGLALDLASRVKDVKGVFAVCPPMRLKDLASFFVPAVDSWNKFMDRVRLESAQMEFVDNHPENPHINYIRNPISGVRELERLMDDVEDKLPGINVPALVVQSGGDSVVNPKGSRKLYQKLGSKDKEYILFSFQRHGILLGEGSEKVHNVIGDFIENINRAEKKKP